ncbi:hypothetical protein VM77_06940 [Citromicrobium sp. JL31]|nr:hypothetical protein WG74_09935 [Citromicrobium sp. JL477]KPM15283.1 hypothetical protein VO58_09150 [Citromicrobium sp. JL1351]KPM19642.1 hypothetical protein VM77_06940 [Citromicrobium sp. JL31]
MTINRSADVNGLRFAYSPSAQIACRQAQRLEQGNSGHAQRRLCLHQAGLCLAIRDAGSRALRAVATWLSAVSVSFMATRTVR